MGNNFFLKTMVYLYKMYYGIQTLTYIVNLCQQHLKSGHTKRYTYYYLCILSSYYIQYNNNMEHNLNHPVNQSSNPFYQ